MRSASKITVSFAAAILGHTSIVEAEDIPVDIDAIVLDTIVVRGDKVGRSLGDETAGTTIIDGEEAGDPKNTDIDDVLSGEANILANEGFSLPSIRGIDSTSGGRPSISAGSQPRTPILVDDVALPSNESSAISQVSLWDLSSVEVARGPQPTSTGRNAIGGAIRVYTNDPTFEVEGASRMLYHTEDHTAYGAFMVNTPLLEDQLALRITGEGSIGESYVDIVPAVPAGFDPEDERYGRIRGKLLYEPSNLLGLSVLLSVDYVKSEQPQEGLVNDLENVRIDDSNPFALVSSYEDLTQSVYQVRTTYDIDDRFSVVGRVAYLDNDLVFRDTGDVINFGFPFILGETGFDKNQIEAETYLQVQDLSVLRRGVLGVIHNTEDEDGYNTGTLAFGSDGQINNTGIYGEAELSADRIIEGLSLIAGARFEIDDRYRSVDAPVGNEISNANFTETAFLPKLGVRYALNEDVAFGYSYTRGFRAGGLDVDQTAPLFSLPVSTSVFEPEYIDQHEVYTRASFLDGDLNLSATGFYYIWDDAQVQGAASFFNGAVSLIGNVPEAVGYGAEFNADYAVLPSLSVRGALGLLHTEITDAGDALASFEGAALPRAPKITASLGLSWQPLENLTASFDVRHVGSTVSGLGQPEMEAYTVADVSAAYTRDTQFGSFEIEGFVTNVFDERYETFKETSAIGTLSAAGRPRTFGLALTARW